MKEQIEKQAIEEMARALCRDQGGGNNHIDKCSDCVCYGICIFIQEATRAYGAGYRKQSEGEWIKHPLATGVRYCSNCGENRDSKSGNFCPNRGAKMKGGAE